jgi:cold shock CspA family protein/uncharacterized LabA/DUF88 family protein
MSSIEFTKIAVFYDGNFFSHVSNYYQFHHKRRARISISGLHDYIRQEIARTDGSDVRYCQIVDAHYFRGRLRTTDAQQRDMLVKERSFDEVLLREGVTTHYLPLTPTGEKGIDVWMALEAYELAILKHYEVCVLVASDGDFLPLVRKLNSIGTRVMVLGWDFNYSTKDGQFRETKTAQSLLRESTYPVMMSARIEHGSLYRDVAIDALFIPVNGARQRSAASDRVQHRLTIDSDKTPWSSEGAAEKDEDPRREDVKAGAATATHSPSADFQVSPKRADGDDAAAASAASADATDPADGRNRPDDATGQKGSAATDGDQGYPDDDYSMLFEVYPLDDFHEDDDDHDHHVLDDEPDTSRRVTGRIQYLRDGYGFIEPDDGGPNIYFFHADVRNSLFPDLRTDDRVEYVPGWNPRGPAALEIVVIR